MTLVELLVVVAIIGLLAVTVLPNVSATAESRRSREAARVASSFVAKAQSRAIGRPEWAGVTFVPPNPNATYAIDLFQSGVPQVYRGEALGATAEIDRNALGVTRSVFYYDEAVAPPPPQVSQPKTIPASRGVKTGDLIRFDGGGPWYELASDGAEVRLRYYLGGFNGAMEMAAQTAQNTPWPAPGRHSFEILRQPVWNGMAFTIPDGRCIDLAWSGYGSPAEMADANPATTTRFSQAGMPVTVLFDATGRVRQIFRRKDWAQPRVTLSGPVFFLVGRVDRALNTPSAPSTYDGKDDSTGFNWQYGDSYWIGIDPASGLVRTAECLPVPGQIDPTNAVAMKAALETSQKFIRSEMPVTGR